MGNLLGMGAIVMLVALVVAVIAGVIWLLMKVTSR